jgi:hypothetical protein
MTKASDVQSERELIRHVTNLCSTGHNIFAAVLISRKYNTLESATVFLNKLKDDYIGPEVYHDLLELIEAFTE